MKFDFIEIGTSDFQTLLQKSNDEEIGLSIDPIKIYLDRLPEKVNKYKLNYAISDKEALVNVFWVHPDDVDNIEKYNLPYWIRGCNSIITPHPTTIKELKNRNLEHLLRVTQCECITWETLINRHNIQDVKHLKIDTEGHDCVILNYVLESSLVPNKITFEVNELTDMQLLETTYYKLNQLGFVKTGNYECDVTYSR